MSLSGLCLSQIPDSLIGIYAGVQYYKPDPDSNWTITPDTEYVTSIDTITCDVNFHGCFFPGASFRTDYTFCNNPPANPYGDVHFFSIDSLCIITDSVATPPPNMHFYYKRFFGKRIPGTLWVGIKEVNSENSIMVFPNPFEEKVKIEVPETKKCEAKVFNIFGKEVYSNVINKTEELDLKFLTNGVYIVMINLGNKGIFYKKIMKN